MVFAFYSIASLSSVHFLAYRFCFPISFALLSAYKVHLSQMQLMEGNASMQLSCIFNVTDIEDNERVH